MVTGSADDSGRNIGEIGRRLDDIAAHLETLTTRLETTYVRFDLFEASKQLSETERLQMVGRIEKLEGRFEWLSRTVGGAIATALIGGVVAYLSTKGK
jgi:hypothetical protein